MKDDREWYLPDRDSMEAIGPVTTTELIQKIKTGHLRIDEYVWGTHFADNQWKRIADLEELQASFVDKPKVLPPPPAHRRATKAKQAEPPKFEFKGEGEYGRENAFRRFPRVPLITEVIIRNSHCYYRAQGVDVSEKGLQVWLNQQQVFKKGEEIVVVVRNAPGIGTFSAPAVIMRVLNEGENHGYGLFFLRLNPLIRRRISQYVLEKLQAGQEKEQQRSSTGKDSAA